MDEDKSLEGLKYDSLVLDHNVHKLIGTLTKLQDTQTNEIPIDQGATWLVTGLGYLKDDTPDNLIKASLDDTIIVSKKELIEFINKK